MKKKLVIISAFIFAAFGASAQGFYADFNVGYGLGFPGNVLGQETHTEIVDGNQTETASNIYGSLGQGLTLQLTPGYMFNEHIGVELGLNYFLGSKVTMYDGTSNITVTALGINKQPYSSGTYTAKSNQFRLLPTLYISTGTTKTLSGYVKAGLVLPIAGKTVSTINNVDAEVDGTGITKDYIEKEITTKGSFSLGFRGAIGLNYNLSDKLSLFAEIYVIDLNIKSKHSEVTKYEYNGVDALSSATTYDKETDYVDDLDASSNNYSYNDNSSEGKPKEVLASKTSFSQTGLQIGIKFNF